MPALTDPKQEAFARFIAAGNTKREAAVLAGFSKKTASSQGTQLAKRLKIAKRIEELQAKVVEKTVELAAKSVLLDIAVKENRLALYQDIQRRLMMIVEERASDPAMKKVPGGSGGFITLQFKSIGAGTRARVVVEAKADTGLAQEIRATMQQAAIELDQWKDGNRDAASEDGLLSELGKALDESPK